MNRIITLWILGFVAISGALLVALVLVRADGAPLLAVLPRERALAAYTALLLFFPLFTLPWVLQRTPRGGGRRAAMVLACDSLIFSSVPLVFCAYISAVSLQGLACAAAMAATAAALPLVLARWSRSADCGMRVCAFVAGWMVVAPCAALLSRGSGAAQLSHGIALLSPLDWVQRICLQREVPSLVPFLALAAAAWMVALPPRRRVGVAVASVLLCLLPMPQAAPRVESLAGGMARSGGRTPVVVVVPEGAGVCSLSTGCGAVEITADGLEHLVLLTPSAEQDHLRTSAGTAAQRISAPWRLIGRDSGLFARLGPGSSLGAGPGGAVHAVSLDARALALGAGACEAFDCIVLQESHWDALAPQQRAVLQGAAAAGALVLLEQSRAASETLWGNGCVRRITQGAVTDGAWRLWRRPLLGSADREFLDTFVPLQWQELDLSSVFWFVVVYHLAFLLAFLLPLILDAHKSPTVYLISVSFVVVIIAGGGYRVLKSIFLKDNQVYTQSMGLLLSPRTAEQSAASAAPPLVLRRFLAYASMSAEERVMEFPRNADVTVLAGTHALQVPRELVPQEHTRWGLSLDRHQDKVLARIDSAEAAPWRFEARVDGSIGIHALQHDGAFAGASVRAALLVEDGRVVAHYRREGERLIAVAADSFFAPGVEASFRKLQGRYGTQMPRHLLVALDGVARGDISADWLVQRDLGCFWMLPWPRP